MAEAALALHLIYLGLAIVGDSWRIGADPQERTQLVTTGPFAHVRNPIFAAVLPTSLGLLLLVPNPAAMSFPGVGRL